MLGVRSDQRRLVEADHLYFEYVGKDTFYGFLASHCGQLFRDGEFAELCYLDNGRDSASPSLLAMVLLLQSHDKVSDEEGKARADFDIFWKVALGIAVGEKPLAKITLPLFRSQLTLHEKVRAIFQYSLRFAYQTGCIKGYRMKAALDTSYILRRGPVKDSYNLLADEIIQVVQALATLETARQSQRQFTDGDSRREYC